jgi:hypothetical protein
VAIWRRRAPGCGALAALARPPTTLRARPGTNGAASAPHSVPEIVRPGSIACAEESRRSPCVYSERILREHAVHVAAARGLGGARTFEQLGGSPISTAQWASGRVVSSTPWLDLCDKKCQRTGQKGGKTAALRRGSAALGDHAPVSVGRRRLWLGGCVGGLWPQPRLASQPRAGDRRGRVHRTGEQGMLNALSSRGKRASVRR